MKKIFFISALSCVLILGGVACSNNGGQGIGPQPNTVPDDLSNNIPNTIQYYNNEYGYSLNFPDDWFIGYLGDSKESARVVWFVSDESDIELKDGGAPLGAKVEVIVHDVAELSEMDSSFPEIGKAQDWLNWQRLGSGELVGELAVYDDEEIAVADSAAIKTTAGDSMFPNAGPVIEVVVYNSKADLVYSIKYLGQEPAYSENLGEFDEILANFNF